MISSISGSVKSTSINSLVVEVGGVGLLLQVPIRIAAKMQVGERVSFHTYLIVREDALTLYGFTEIVDRDFFELLLSFHSVSNSNSTPLYGTTLQLGRYQCCLGEEVPPVSCQCDCYHCVPRLWTLERLLHQHPSD